MHNPELPTHNRQSIYHKIIAPATAMARKASSATIGMSRPTSPRPPSSPTIPRRVSYAHPPTQQPLPTPMMETVDQAVKNAANAQHLQLSGSMTTDDFTRAVAVATVSALRHQQTVAHSPARIRTSATENEAAPGAHGGHDAPSWSRTTSASVLLGCTALYAIIAGTLCNYL